MNTTAKMFIMAQKVKPNKIKLYRWAFDEIESYSLLKVTSEEAKELIRADKEGWKNQIIHGVNEYVHEVTEPLDEVWLSMVAKHKQNNKDFMDVSKKYKNYPEGTSCLIRDPNTHTIRVAFRPKNQRPNINILFIDDVKREEFFADSHHSLFWKLEHKYGISVEDTEVYSKWSQFMNEMYILNVGD